MNDVLGCMAINTQTTVSYPSRLVCRRIWMKNQHNKYGGIHQFFRVSLVAWLDLKDTGAVRVIVQYLTLAIQAIVHLDHFTRNRRVDIRIVFHRLNHLRLLGCAKYFAKLV